MGRGGSWLLGCLHGGRRACSAASTLDVGGRLDPGADARLNPALEAILPGTSINHRTPERVGSGAYETRHYIAPTS